MKKSPNNILVFFFLIWLIGLESCGQPNMDMEKYKSFLTQKIESRDSLYILYTAKEWGKHNWDSWEDYSKMYQMSNDQVKYSIDATFYSPDRKKILVWVGEKFPNAKSIEMDRTEIELNKICPTSGDTVHNLSAMIGIRNNINQIWKLYPFDRISATCYEKKEVGIYVLSRFYFDEMKYSGDHWIVQSGNMKGHKQMRNYGYNLQDKAFWDSCWIFEKDTVGSYGLCIFQVTGYRYMGLPCNKDCGQPYEIPKIIYPDSILRLYGRE